MDQQNQNIFESCATDLVTIIKLIPARAAARSCPLNADTIPCLAWLSMLRWERKLGLVVPDDLNVDIAKLTNDIDSFLTTITPRPVLGPGEPRVRVNEGADVMIRDLIQSVRQQATSLDHTSAGSEHLLLALASTTSQDLSRILSRNGISYQVVKDNILELYEQL